MLGVSLPFLLLESLLLSAVLLILNRRGVGAAAVAAATVVTSLLLHLALNLALSGPAPFRRLVVQWLLIALVPGMFVFAVSRLEVLARRPWLLLAAGPFSFLLAVIVGMVAFNVWLNSR